MITNSINSVAVLVAAFASVCAWADGGARVHPLPPSARSVDSPGISTKAEVAEIVVSTPHGAMRVRADASDVDDASDETGRTGVSALRTVHDYGPDGQIVRVAPGVQSGLGASAAAGTPALPEGALVVELGEVKMVRMPNVVDGLQAPAETTAMPAGVRIVDLPPGAVAPAGMPEPMTLYRVTARPAAATALPGEPE
jgi:hypothetical protein